MAYSGGIIVTNDTPKWRFMKKQMMVALKQHGEGLKNNPKLADFLMQSQ